MMFLLDLAFAAELIALGVGVGFLVWAYRNEGAGIALAKVFGYIITIAATLGLLCTIYYGTTYWSQGYFKTPMASMVTKQHMMQPHPMMQQKQSIPSKPHQHQGSQ